MNKLDTADRARILHLLCEGNSIRAVTRLTGVAKNTVGKLLVDAGKACMAYHDEHVRNVQSKRVQVYEIWSFVYAKAKQVPKAKKVPPSAGDAWTWTALDADTKLIVIYFVGGRDAECALWFLDDLRKRLANRVQLTSDGHKAYVQAVEAAFGDDIDFAQLVKIYGTPVEGMTGRYSPGVVTGARKTKVTGDPDRAHVSTSFVERSNLTMRMHMRRFTRLTNAFSKKVENHAYAIALHFMFYNFVRIHQKLRVTPAMAAGLTDKLWEISDLVALVDAAEEPPKKRGPYKPRKKALPAS